MATHCRLIWSPTSFLHDHESLKLITSPTGTYDVQAVTLTPQTSGGLEVSCTFMDGSVASGCEITLCRMGQADDTVCMNITLQRDSPSTLVEISGNYSITQVVEVESDGQRVTVDLQYNQGSLVALVTASVRVTTAATTISKLKFRLIQSVTGELCFCCCPT